MKPESTVLAQLRSDLLDAMWLQYPLPLSLDQLETAVHTAYSDPRKILADRHHQGRAVDPRSGEAHQALHQGLPVDREGTTGPPAGRPIPRHQQPTHTTTRGSMTIDEKILAVYQQVRSRYNFFDYWEKVTEANQTLDASDPFMNESKLCAKADEALNRDVVVAFAKEIALWWENESLQAMIQKTCSRALRKLTRAHALKSAKN
jgi:hypothetical protein